MNLEELRNHVVQFTHQKVAIEQQFHQISGALNFASHMVAVLEKAAEEALKAKDENLPTTDGVLNDGVNEQATEQAA